MNQHAKIVCDIIFDWPNNTYGEITQALLDAPTVKGIFSTLIEVQERGVA
jgi:hypothetical protein